MSTVIQYKWSAKFGIAKFDASRFDDFTDGYRISAEANARIQIQSQFTKLGTARIQINDTTQVYDGTARIKITSQLTKDANARILIEDNQFTKDANSRILIENKQFTKDSIASIQVNDIEFIKIGNATIKIEGNQFVKTGDSSITLTRRAEYEGNAFITTIDRFKPIIKIAENIKPRIKSIETFN